MSRGRASFLDVCGLAGGESNIIIKLYVKNMCFVCGIHKTTYTRPRRRMMTSLGGRTAEDTYSVQIAAAREQCMSKRERWRNDQFSATTATVFPRTRFHRCVYKFAVSRGTYRSHFVFVSRRLCPQRYQTP